MISGHNGTSAVELSACDHALASSAREAGWAVLLMWCPIPRSAIDRVRFNLMWSTGAPDSVPTVTAGELVIFPAGR